MAMSLAELGASKQLPEVGYLVGMDLEPGLDCLCKTTVRGVPTVRMVVTNKPASLTDCFFKNNLCDWFNSFCPSCRLGVRTPSYTSLVSTTPIYLSALVIYFYSTVVLKVLGASTALKRVIPLR